MQHNERENWYVLHSEVGEGEPSPISPGRSLNHDGEKSATEFGVMGTLMQIFPRFCHVSKLQALACLHCNAVKCTHGASCDDNTSNFDQNYTMHYIVMSSKSTKITTSGRKFNILTARLGTEIPLRIHQVKKNHFLRPLFRWGGVSPHHTPSPLTFP